MLKQGTAVCIPNYTLILKGVTLTTKLWISMFSPSKNPESRHLIVSIACQTKECSVWRVMWDEETNATEGYAAVYVNTFKA